jgi:hypothetical protein
MVSSSLRWISNSTRILPTFLVVTESEALSYIMNLLSEFPMASNAPLFHKCKGNPGNSTHKCLKDKYSVPRSKATHHLFNMRLLPPLTHPFSSSSATSSGDLHKKPNQPLERYSTYGFILRRDTIPVPPRHEVFLAQVPIVKSPNQTA